MGAVTLNNVRFLFDEKEWIMKRYFNSYRMLDTERLFIGYSNKKLICELNAYHLKIEPRVSGISSITFDVYEFANGIKNGGYDDIDIGRYIWSDQNGWFRISNIEKKDDGENPRLEITCYDLSIELTQTLLTSFGSMGTDTDEQGGLDRYALYDASDQAHSIAHIFMAKNPGWTFKYIDDEISKNHRSFSNDSINSYGFLTGEVSKAFDCVFVFDGNDRTVSAYKPENLGKEIPFIISFYNLLKQIDIKWDEDDIKTVLHVSGGNDATGTALSIAGVNPSGNDMISNFSYFYKDMSAELVTRLKEYYQRMNESSELKITALSQLKVLQDELFTLNSHEPSTQTSTVWSEYGLTQLKAKAAEYLNNMSVASDGNLADPVVKQQYDDYADLYKAVNAEISVRQTQITAKEAEVTAKKTEASSYVVDIVEVLGDELYKELLPFVKEDTLCDDSYIATDAMSDNEILEMKKDLYDHGVEQLNRVCYPQFNMTLDSVNFTVLFKYADVIEQLELGDILFIRLEDDNMIKARLLKMEFNWDDLTDFKLTFSSKSNLEDGYFTIEEIRNMTQRNSTTLDYGKSGWNGASQQANTAFFATQKEFMDLSMQQIVSNGINQEVIINSAGIMLKKWLPDENKYAPEMAWFTNRQLILFESDDGTNLKNPKLAIGKVYVTKNGVTTSFYGVSADVVYGKMFFGQSLTIQNANNTLIMDENGFKASATNGFSVKINPDTPDDIFTISENSTKLMYIDAVNRKLVFKGRIEANEGLIGNWTIGANALTSGGVGMSSSTATNAVSFWAGNATPTSAPYRVLNNGKLFSSDADISGKITATSGVIGGWTIDGNSLVGTNASYIRGGRINIGNGFFGVSDNEVYIGDFYTTYTDRALFMSIDQYSGMSASTGSNRFALWGGYNGGSPTAINNYVFAVSGIQAYAKELTITGDPWWEGWTLTQTMKRAYERIEALEERVSNL